MYHLSLDMIRQYRQSGIFKDETFVHLFRKSLEKHPEREALVDAANSMEFFGAGPRRLTYAQAWAEARSLAAMLLRHGLRKDDVLGVQLPNGNELVLTYFACAMLGVMLTPAPMQYRDHELSHILDHTKARAMMTFVYPKFDSALLRCERLAQEQGAKSGQAPLVMAWYPAAASYEEAQVQATGHSHVPLTPNCASAADLAALDAYIVENPVDADATFTLCWTSGTEGLPKGVPRSHNQWMIAAHTIVQAVDLQPGARLLNPFPLTNPGSLTGMVVPWLLTGGTLVQHQPFDLQVFLKQIKDEAIDYTCASPALLASLLQNEALTEGIDWGRLKRISSGAAPLSEWLVRGFSERFGVEIINCYGSSEGAALYSCALDVPDPAQRAQFFPRIGAPGLTWSLSISEWMQTRLIDADTGAEVTEIGKQGELRVKGPNLFGGYYNAPELNDAAFDADGYYRTGDTFEIAGDKAQFYKFVGRSKDIVIRGGFNISAAEIEMLIQGHPKVHEVAIIGEPDPRLGERMCAVVVPAPGVELELAELNAYLKDEVRIAAYKLPERLVLLDSLPRNAMGKVIKRQLREQVSKEQS